MKVLIGIFVYVLLGNIAFSQAPTSTLSQNDVMIGIPVTLTYLVPLPKDASYIHIPRKGNFPASKSTNSSSSSSSDIEIRDVFFDTVVVIQGKKFWKGMYTLVAWDEGSYLLAAQKVNINDEDIVLPAVQLNARLVVQKEGGGLYDIEETYAELPEEPSVVFTFLKKWGWVLLSLLGVAALLFWLMRRKKGTQETAKALTLKEKTLLSIDQLEKQKLWAQGEMKEHYSTLSFILRTYLSARYSLNLLENTSIEAQLILKQYGLDEQLLSDIGLILNGSDLVKFAKSAPEEKLIRANLDDCRSIVERTSIPESSDV
ncbi:MAG: hypothetical protein RL632_2114 [Bacteroidota bacterium]|jgi:hypothetical protein